jgi:hypothetical protein
MQVAVVTAATGKGYGDLRPETAMVKAALLYASDVRLISGKLPMLLVQTGEQMRGIGRLKELVEGTGAEDSEILGEILDAVRRRRPDAVATLEKVIKDGGSASEYLDALGTAWQSFVLPRLNSAPAEQHEAFVRDFLPDFVATYARRRAPSGPARQSSR